MKRPIHEIEAEIFERGREVLRKMLEAHIRARGVGDVGPGVEVAEDGETVPHTHRRLQVCSESTLFGLGDQSNLAGCDQLKPCRGSVIS